MGNMIQDLLFALFDTLQISSFQHKCIFLNCLHFDTFGRYIYLFNIIRAVFRCVLC